MSYIYAKAADLDGEPLVGSHQCVALVQIYAKAPLTAVWKQGAQVRANQTVVVGTAIATFKNGRYPNQPHGNHAALYLSQNAAGIYVVDQWKGGERPTIMRRLMRFKGRDKTGHYIDPSNNGDAFSVIE